MFFHVVWICLWFIVFWNRTDAELLSWRLCSFNCMSGHPGSKTCHFFGSLPAKKKKGSICENPMNIGDDTAIWLLKYVDSISIWLNMAIFYFMFPMSHCWSWWKEGKVPSFRFCRSFCNSDFWSKLVQHSHRLLHTLPWRQCTYGAWFGRPLLVTDQLESHQHPRLAMMVNKSVKFKAI